MDTLYIVTIWIVLSVLGYYFKNKILLILAGLTLIIWAFEIINTDFVYAIILILIGFYEVWSVTEFD